MHFIGGKIVQAKGTATFTIPEHESDSADLAFAAALAAFVEPKTHYQVKVLVRDKTRRSNKKIRETEPRPKGGALSIKRAEALVKKPIGQYTAIGSTLSAADLERSKLLGKPLERHFKGYVRFFQGGAAGTKG